MVSKKLPLITHLLIWGSFFIWLWSRALLPRPEGLLASHLAHWTDGAAHLAYMSAFAYRTYFPMMHPLFYGHTFSYSFGADLLGGLLTRTGIPLWLAYNAVGLGLTIGVLILLWWFYKVVFGGKWIPTVASSLFILSGGSGWRYFVKDVHESGFWATVSALPHLYTQQEDKGLVWLNVVIGELLPQRAFLLGLIIGLFCLGIWYQHLILQKTQRPWLLVFTGILAGLLPVIHPHTLIVLAVMGLSMAIYALVTFPRILHTTYYILLPTILVGFPLYITFIGTTTSESFFRVQLGWMAATKHVNWLWFWLDNWGLFFPLSITSYFIVPKKIRIILIPCILLFLFSNIFLFQPYEWDNAKILTWVYLIFSGSVAVLFQKLWQKKVFPRILHTTYYILLTVIFFFTIFAGLLDNLRALEPKQNEILLFPQESVRLAERFRAVSHPDSVVLTATFHDNWVATLTGRQVLIGYRGWMWTYGINDAAQYATMKSMYRGEEGTEVLLARYHINYVVVGPKERSEFHVNQQYFDTHYPAVIVTPNTKIYRIP